MAGPLFAYQNVGDDSYYAVYVSLGGIINYVTVDNVDEDDVQTYALSRRIGATAVPEPASLALLGLGLVAFGLRRRVSPRR